MRNITSRESHQRDQNVGGLLYYISTAILSGRKPNVPEHLCTEEIDIELDEKNLDGKTNDPKSLSHLD